MSINAVNPYANNNHLSTLEQDVLWEFAKLNDKVKRASNLAKLTAESPNEALLAELRTLEKRMGMVLTLFQASVWGVLQESQAAEEARIQREEQEAYYHQQMQQRQQQRNMSNQGYQYGYGGQGQERSYDDSRGWSEDSTIP
ncbi:DASH complex subunit DAD3 [Kwoniella mangroviensis CBS 10435]|uniref:DASH complex subunit DAD3 n=1 Tax=Kwoniella mangroviensis CBS 10435 TaxID=1331196 RepID=A0A1B9IJM6_9TREE|nr:DASH complex subunit DAD3 [Kwoniella mangroviensis CBS 10435]OCF71760.1 DASH complex subunit DAD3 [Kwoniella mangroviensis CBS 8886]